MSLSCRVGVGGFFLFCFCNVFTGFAMLASFAICLLCPPSGFLCCVGPASFSRPLRFIHTGHPGSLEAWFPLQLMHFRLLCRHVSPFSHSLHSCLGCSADMCSVLEQCTHLGLWLQARRRRHIKHLPPGARPHPSLLADVSERATQLNQGKGSNCASQITTC